MANTVFRSGIIDAPVDTVWSLIRDFNGLPNWHPDIADSHIEDGKPSDQIGCIRNFNLKDGGNIRETLLLLSDITHTCTYDIIVSPMPLWDYVATLRLLPITETDRTYVEWTADFLCDAGDRDDLIKLVGDSVFLGGFGGIRKTLGVG